MYFLVIGRATMDDIPLRLFDERTTKNAQAEAHAFAQKVTYEDVTRVGREVMQLDFSTLNTIAVVGFDSEGTPKYLEIAKIMDETEDEPQATEVVGQLHLCREPPTEELVELKPAAFDGTYPLPADRGTAGYKAPEPPEKWNTEGE